MTITGYPPHSPPAQYFAKNSAVSYREVSDGNLLLLTNCRYMQMYTCAYVNDRSTRSKTQGWFHPLHDHSILVRLGLSACWSAYWTCMINGLWNNIPVYWCVCLSFFHLWPWLFLDDPTGLVAGIASVPEIGCTWLTRSGTVKTACDQFRVHNWTLRQGKSFAICKAFRSRLTVYPNVRIIRLGYRSKFIVESIDGRPYDGLLHTIRQFMLSQRPPLAQTLEVCKPRSI